jgi:hypothetical protein
MISDIAAAVRPLAIHSSSLHSTVPRGRLPEVLDFPSPALY